MRLALVLAALLAPIAIAAAPGGPVAPCGQAGSPSIPQFGDPPNARNWHPADLASSWVPAPCTAWAAQPFTVLTALAGRFVYAGSADDLLLRFGAFSAWRGIQYWSVTDGRWNTLVVEYRKSSGAGGLQDVRGQMWVRADGLVLKQQAALLTSQLVFVRVPERASGEW